MSVPVAATNANRLDRILIHLGVLQSGLNEVKQTLGKSDGDASRLETRVREIEKQQAVLEAGQKSSAGVWLFVWQALNSVGLLAFAALNYLTKGH